MITLDCQSMSENWVQKLTATGGLVLRKLVGKDHESS